MKSRRRLALRRETLTELTPGELTFAGAAAPTLYAGCSVDEAREYAETIQWRLSLHQHCTWSCI